MLYIVYCAIQYCYVDYSNLECLHNLYLLYECLLYRAIALERVFSVDGHILFVLIKSGTRYLVTSAFISMNRSYVSEMSSST